MADRHSQTDEPDLIQDPTERALAEARNALRQFDVGMVLLDHWLDAPARARHLRPSDLLTLNRFALEDVNRFAGTFRNTNVTISGSHHQPPPASKVPELVEDFCDYINANWQIKSAMHLSAYALWRINWIHPFADGNGRTARIVSYVVLSAKLGLRLPGAATIPEQIAAQKTPYYEALEAADRALEKGQIDTSRMETILERSLQIQLESAIQEMSSGTQAQRSTSVVVPGEPLESRVEKLEASLLTYRRSRPLFEVMERNPVLFTGAFGLFIAIVSSLITYFLAK
jgi:Fic family protein